MVTVLIPACASPFQQIGAPFLAKQFSLSIAELFLNLVSTGTQIIARLGQCFLTCPELCGRRIQCFSGSQIGLGMRPNFNLPSLLPPLRQTWRHLGLLAEQPCGLVEVVWPRGLAVGDVEPLLRSEVGDIVETV